MSAQPGEILLHPSWERIFTSSVEDMLRSSYGCSQRVSFSKMPFCTLGVWAGDERVVFNPELVVHPEQDAPLGWTSELSMRLAQHVVFVAIVSTLTPLRFYGRLASADSASPVGEVLAQVNAETR
ncbi:hypothetical protein [Corynebacterium anserum]|uniref:Uncharacterized protein n=1 Tax=Corynebacterium anserum TaxID=2684406 RepID=A0A7G7YMB2_9CORY|nr:hypothetical protein [Corynebacterium anserum]MBC2680989.1 hypothetical protein [Corynebacterium anserum]QNH95632.1 hypothetical protein GP473_02085 [Corynebacterium anserum]